MTLSGRDLISINDFSNEEIEEVLSLADDMSSALETGKMLDFCRGKELYTIFYESSTRTRSSFETAMHRLGGTVVSHAEAQVTSAVAKGESIADTVRVLERYADIIVMRHPLDGSTRLAAEYSLVPVISGGDGAHEHPTQTLLDLYTIGREKGAIRGKIVALCGDLRHGRTVHSLAIGLARFGAEIVCIAPSGFELPDHVRDTLQSYKCKFTEYESQEGFMSGLLENIDVFYFTRLQQERLSSGGSSDVAGKSYRINRQMLEKAGENALIMHPLPRTGELSYELDQDKRAAYFRQAGYGVPVRMALIALLLGAVKPKENDIPRTKISRMVKECPDVRCLNERCITSVESYLMAKFCHVLGKPQLLKCYYCDWPVQVE